ncbi:MAG: hypothetical protein M1820_009462 [Bogoriella megaspora]|nr:MAG: hypothetical protein M1820_009462 [Bogoriella megaspora]
MALISKEQAKRVVLDMRASRRVDDPEDENAKDLARSCKVLSRELNTNLAHFILELVQNADDTKYDSGVTPKLVFLYREDGYLWVGCNERGFTAENVGSICRINLSTKGVEDAEKTSIGEKGIGFKSVFKVADKVWVSSGPFTFRFDRDAFLGMIAPIWDENFPNNPLLKEMTMLCLRIPKADHQKKVDEHLRAIQPELPLFLRNIAQIQVIFSDRFDNVKQNYTIARESSDALGAEIQLVKHDGTTREKNTLLRLVKVEHIADDMPYEERRDGVESSKLQILFPMTEDGQPEMKNRCVYNYLPIRAYGLPFLLNADFLLSANREDVEQNNDWNGALLNATIDLFVKAVDRFNVERVARYTWPAFLQSQGSASSTAFASVLNDIIKRLKEEPVLEAQNGVLKEPKILARIPAQYMDVGNPPRPLIGPLGVYVSTRYYDTVVSELVSNRLEVTVFFYLVRDFYESKAQRSDACTIQWHARVAKALTGKVALAAAKTVKLIPLRDNTWTEANDKTVFFPELNDGFEIPQGIDIAIVSSAAAQSADCRALYKWLGVKDLSVKEVCGLIIQQHEECNTESYGGWSRETIIGHAWYLFEASKNYNLQKLDKLCLAVDGSTTLVKASMLYIHDETPFSVAKLIPKDSNLVQYIDPAYLDIASDTDASGFVVWLRESLGSGSIPRISTDDKEIISKEFKYILYNHSSQTFLGLLKTHWSTYSYSIENYRKIRDEIAFRHVSCTDGSIHRLNRTFLPTAPILKTPYAADSLPLLDVDDPNNPQWSNLSHFGVSTITNLQFYCRLLDELPMNKEVKPKQDDLAVIYEQIQARYYDDEPRVRSTFEDRVIFVTSATANQWARLRDCVWHAPPQLQKLHVLSSQYPSVERLFVGRLKLPNAGVTFMVNELKKYDRQASKVADIKGLLEAINTRIKNGKDSSAVSLLEKNNIFPVRMAGVDIQLTSISASNWCIADTRRLRDCFKNKILLLDFSVREVAKLEPLLKRLSLLDRRLSSKVKEETRIRGSIESSIQLTNKMQSKATHIARLVPKEKQSHIYEQFDKIQVFCAANLVLHRSVSLGPATNVTHIDTGTVLISFRLGGSPSMYLKVSDVSSGDLPYYQISEELCACFGFGTKEGRLLQFILTTSNERQIEDMLDREKIDELHDLANVRKEEGVDYDEPPDSASPRGTQPHFTKPKTFNTSSLRRPGSSNMRRDGQTGQPTPTPQKAQFAASSQPVASFNMSIDAIRAAANRVKSEHIINFREMHGSSSDRPVSSAAAPGLSQSPRFASECSSKGRTTGNRNSKQFPFDLSGLEEALHGFAPEDGTHTPHQTNIPNVPQEPQQTEHEDKVGALGEAFVFEWMKKEFRIDIESWTSDIRTRFDHPAMTEFEGDFADFTIKGGAAAVKVGQWLQSHGYGLADAIKCENMTFNIEVKTTTGACNDSFSLSNNQMGLIRRWHESHNDVCILLRVFEFDFDFKSIPKMQPYNDPYAMHLAGELRFQPQGFLVQHT